MAGIAGNFSWPNEARAALSLAFEGPPLDRIEDVLNVVNLRHLRSTFYFSPGELLAGANVWRKASAVGHELGVASLHGVTDGGRIYNWTFDMLREDFEMTRELLEDLGTHGPLRTFAIPGPDLLCAEGPYDELLTEEFGAVVGLDEGINHAVFGGRWLHVIDPELFEEYAEETLDVGAWVIIRGKASIKTIEQVAALNRDHWHIATVREIAGITPRSHL